MPQSQEEKASPVGLPRIINVVGLKDSGKTAVAEGLIAELIGRGYRVGAVKTTRHPTLSVDAEGTDTRRFADAGAAFVIGLLDTETHYFERRPARSTLREAARFFAADTQLVVCEGTVEPDAHPLFIVCLRSVSDFERTIATREVPLKDVLAISGLVASAGPTGLAAPCFDITDPRQRASLADLILQACGSPRPLGRP
ncbi:MAG: molybdopterin-guanine dinucleotide biosynthesis protein MobB [Spirochaetia bacterium]|jgi:molybdopterin-guanine dinucleotide biosynthesis protein MobB